MALVSEHFPGRDSHVEARRWFSVCGWSYPEQVDAEQLFDDAIEAGISIAPGHIFSPCACYTNFIRLSYGHPWTERTENAIKWLGQKVTSRQAGHS